MSRSNAPTDSVASAVLSLAQIIAEDIDQDRSEVFAWLRPWNSAAREAFDATARTILSKKREFSYFRQFIFLEGMNGVREKAMMGEPKDAPRHQHWGTETWSLEWSVPFSPQQYRP